MTAIDGLVLDVPDTPDNGAELGRSGNATTPSPFPQVRLVALAECGTHGIVDAAFGPVGTGEQTLAALSTEAERGGAKWSALEVGWVSRPTRRKHAEPERRGR